MTGMALLLDLLKSTQGSSSSGTLILHSHGLFTAGAAAVAASAAAAYITACRPFASGAIFGDGGISVAYCDAGATATWNENYIPNLSSATENMLPSATENDKSITFECKEYPIELRPLFSAFHLRPLALTSIRSFLLFYLPLLELRPPVEDDDDLPHLELHPPVEDNDDLLQDGREEKHVDLVTPFRKSLKQIVRETSVVTIRRVLERLAVQCCSQRMAWKLLKDVSKSVRRKAKRDMQAYLFLFQVSRTTFRGHALGVFASWIVQIIIDFYIYFIRKPDCDSENLNFAEKNRLFWKRVYSTTIKCTSSLIFASIGGGIGSLFHPSMGQWIGSALGDFAGPFIAIVTFEKLHLQI